MNYYVGIDVGGTNVKYGLLDEAGQILHHDKVKTANQGEKIIEAIAEIVTNYQKEYPIKAVGVSVPGVVEDDGFMTTGGAIFDFYGVHLQNILTERLALPVFVENDANSAALAEKWIGAGQGAKHSLCVVVGTGIGGGIIINHQLFRGAHATAGEFGFMIVEPIENQDTRMATLSLTGSVQCGLVLKYLDRKDLTDENGLDGETIFQMAAAGDLLAEDVIDIFYERLAIGIFNMATAFDPEIILIGGAISGNPEFIQELQQRVSRLKNDHRDMKQVTLASIVPCEFLNNAGIIGAVYKAISEIQTEERVRG